MIVYPLKMIQANVGLNWPSILRYKDIWINVQGRQKDDVLQAKAKAHLTLWVRWAKNVHSSTHPFDKYGQHKIKYNCHVPSSPELWFLLHRGCFAFQEKG
jgi:hypothetical protein